jgi:hypothetical protein
MKGVEASLLCGKLTLVNIGRHLPGSALIKNKIKQSDRLLGNDYLFNERELIYKAIVKFFICANTMPIILVDWSGVTNCGAFHMIRASIPIKGRTLTIYEEVYPESKKDSPKSNRTFLQNLAKILPLDCCPVIVTDAGFRNPWFKEVLKLGWNFVGRVRNETHVQKTKETDWKPCKSLYKEATLKERYLGEFNLAKSNPLTCKMFLVKGKKRFRKKKNLRGHKVRCSSSLKHAKRNKEPWLVATSLSTNSAKKIINIYKLRMSIEQGFRDTKNQRNGFCLRETRSNNVQRLSILLMIGALATFLICMYGIACQLQKMQYQFQTNSIKHRTVLSWFFLGMIMAKQNTLLTEKSLHRAIRSIFEVKICYC